MDDLLPSYESAIQKDPWILIAPYLTSDAICTAALVCKKWHKIFTPHLWGSPASHFGVENDTVYVALTRFKRTLPFARPHVRGLTHTLQFPPAHAEIYETRIPEHVTRAPLPPVEHDRLSGEIDDYESEDLVSHLRQRLTKGFVGSLAIEESRDVGITHLYVSRNPITVEGITGLLRSKRLRVLDIGVLPAVLMRPLQPSYEDVDGSMDLPGVAKMTPVLSEYAAKKLRYLRVNHQVVTEDAPTDAVPSPRAELSGDFGRYAPSDALELEAPQHHEMDTSQPMAPVPELGSVETAVFELPGSPAFPVELPGSFPTVLAEQRNTGGSARPPSIKITAESPEVKRGPAYAPEPVFVDSPISSNCTRLPSRDSRTTSTGDSSPDRPEALSPVLLSARDSISDGSTNQRSRQNSIHFVEDRKARLELRQSQENRLHPGMLPRVHTLVLTDVPTSTDDPNIVHRLIQYIKDAAEEASIAKQRARHTYMLPPGRSRTVAEKEYARSVFALRHIVFEMAPPQVEHKKISTSWRAYPTKSSTEDADSEAFWEAATHDFSFFGDEECGVPTQEPGRGLPLAAMSGLELAVHGPAAPPRPRKLDPVVQPRIDVVAEIGKYRRERRAAYSTLLDMGEVDPDVEGYWPGDITVVRKPLDADEGELDCYGNRYQGWGLYR
ncbi:hypothetical protein E8E13_004906 [Curvularia kusanoi]|uniref:F-box domain-containing protein n=1 Tax=Curvularia kusanoi TaxID=90978 RepID=A0A9P4TB24_CURKU|nr:hypothetical protein E8E13_004906 [Curvularia kusanoi]